MGARVVFGLPKGGRTRDVPLPDSVALQLAAHLERFPSRQVTLPWGMPAGEPTTVRLLFTTREGGAIYRNTFNHHVWKPALRSAVVPATRDNGMHALRHYYASMLLHEGVSIRTLADYLGHSDPGFTLRTYCHLMPASEEQVRRVVDAALRSCAPDVRQEGSVGP